MATLDRRSLSGPEKAAILLIAVGDELAATILKELDDAEIQRIASYMSSMGSIPKKLVEEVAEEFIDAIESGRGGAIAAGRDYMRKMLEASLDKDKATEIMDRIAKVGTEEYGGGLEAVRNLEARTIATFMKNEHPQTCAIILAHLTPQHAAAVIKEIPDRMQPEITFRLATLDRVPPGVIKELDEALAYEFRSTGTMEGSQIGGINTVAEVINNLDSVTERNVLAEIEAVNPDLAEDIKQLMFVFEDLIDLDDRGMQGIMKEVNSDELLLALKTCSDPLKEKIFSAMSERAALMMKEDLEAMGPVRVSEVERAQQSIVRTVKRLEEEGKIILAGGGEELV